MSRVKHNKAGQQYMPEADTPLSNAAEGYVAALADVQKANDSKEAAMKELIEQMRKKKLNSLTHNGSTLTIKQGHVTKETIVIR